VTGCESQILVADSPADSTCKRFWLSRLALDLFAFVLLLAAGLKMRSLLVEGAGANAFVTVVAIVTEWVVALWLLSCVGQFWARRAAVALLAVFVTINAWRLWRGASDCGCFGNLRVHPIWTMAFDATVLAGIAWCRRGEFGTGEVMKDRGPRIVFALLLAIFLPAAVIGSAYLRAFAR
jgi:hypothetical protein